MFLRVLVALTYVVGSIVRRINSLGLVGVLASLIKFLEILRGEVRGSDRESLSEMRGRVMRD